MARLRFGTDGIRGRAGTELTTELAYDLGLAAAHVLRPPELVIARDTRESGVALARAVAKAANSVGVVVIDLGVAPTPAVAHVAAERAAVGVMVSASHNPWFDNGIKLFTPAGRKLSDIEQGAIERQLEHSASGGRSERVSSEVLSSAAVIAKDGASHRPELLAGWVEAVTSSATSSFDGLRVVIDAANGAASHVAGPIFADLGANVIMLANTPDGRNINDGCGSTDTTGLQRSVTGAGADLGIAFDGDADRLIAVDNLGQVVDGDQLMAMVAVDLRDQGRLADSTVVVTVMSNLGFHRAMQSQSITVEVTPVGDRHILESLHAHGWSFGGEQSGHLIFHDLATTGDGVLSAVQLLGLVVRSGRTLAELSDEAMVRFPQVLRNVKVANQVDDLDDRIAEAVERAERRLGDNGRVLIRPSGTEPVIRVMVEAAVEDEAQDVCVALCDAVLAACSS